MAYKEVENEEMKFVNELVLSKDNITEQLKLLSKYKDREDVQKYINDLKETTSFEYVKYLIGKHYEGKKVLVVPKKTTPEKMFKLLLKPSTKREKIYNPGKTSVRIGDVITVNEGPYKYMKGEVLDINNEYSEVTIKCDLFGQETLLEVEFKDIEKTRVI